MRESRRFSDDSWEESLGKARDYGCGTGADTVVTNVGFNGVSRQDDVWRDEEETCAEAHPDLPNA
jgi:hypothetical protein